MSGRPHPGSERPLHGAVQGFDLSAEADKLRAEEAFRGKRRNSITLRKGGGMSVVLLVMGSGDRLEEHASPGPITISVREGRIRFTTAEGEVEAGPETLLACDAGVRHAVEAVEDTVCVVTVAGERRG